MSNHKKTKLKRTKSRRFWKRRKVKLHIKLFFNKKKILGKLKLLIRSFTWHIKKKQEGLTNSKFFVNHSKSVPSLRVLRFLKTEEAVQ